MRRIWRQDRSLVVLTAVFSLVAASPAARGDAPCQPPYPDQQYGGIGDVRVYLYDPTKPLDAACNIRANRPVALRPYTGYDGGLVRMAVAGAFFAYVATPDDTKGAFYINSVNLFTGRYAHGFNFFPSPGTVSDLVVKSNGSMAWIESDFTPIVTVRLADRRGVRVPRRGHQVTEGSLRLRGSILSWKKGRRRYSTRLH